MSPAHPGRSKPAFQVVVVYEDFAAGRSATDTCNLLLDKLGDEFELRCSTWKFETLRNESLRQTAALEATEADTIIVATHRVSPLPSELTRWFDSWIAIRGDHPAALIALVDNSMESRGEPSATHRYLQCVAAAAHMDFLTQVCSYAANESAPGGFPQRWGAVAQDPSWVPSERHWGINE